MSTYRTVVVLAPLMLALLLGSSLGCRPKPGSKGGKSGKSSSSRVRSTADQRLEVAALEAEIAGLKHNLADRAVQQHRLPAINAHEHLLYQRHLERYLAAARKMNIQKTVIVASSKFTAYGKGEKGEPFMSENFQTLLAVDKKYPGEIIPFFAIDTHDKDMLSRAKAHVKAGAKGVKLYSGHSNLHDMPLDKEELMPLYAYFEEIGLPMNWHINLTKWHGEFENVMDRYPKLNVMVPHYGVAFWYPQKHMATMTRLMRKYPNLYLDGSLGTREILIDGLFRMAEPEAKEIFLRFIDEFQDRIVWGTDSVITGNREKTTAWYYKVISATRDQLEKPVFHFELAEGYSKYFTKKKDRNKRDPTGRIEGLDLPESILRKIYWDNTVKWLRLEGDAAKPQGPVAPAAPAPVNETPAPEAPVADAPAAEAPAD